MDDINSRSSKKKIRKTIRLLCDRILYKCFDETEIYSRGGSKIDGLIIIDKKEGYTSHDVVAILRRITGIKRIGHTGTLDPMATGVLPVCIGRATKIVEYMEPFSKEYRCTMMLGITSDTYDIWGNLEPAGTGQLEDPEKPAEPSQLAKPEEIEQSAQTRKDVKPSGSSQTAEFAEPAQTDDHVSSRAIEEAFEKYKGWILQKPPIYSAIKVKGKKLYEYARRGQNVEIEPRKVFISKLEIEKIDLSSGSDFADRADLSSGSDLAKGTDPASGADLTKETDIPNRADSAKGTELTDGTDQAIGNDPKNRTDQGGGFVTFSVECSKGTYIRSICHDIGQDLGCGAVMSSLRRTRTGPFTEEDAISIEEVKKLSKEELNKYILPIEKGLPHLGAGTVDKHGNKWFRNGGALAEKRVRLFREPDSISGSESCGNSELSSDSISGSEPCRNSELSSDSVSGSEPCSISGNKPENGSNISKRKLYAIFSEEKELLGTAVFDEEKKEYKPHKILLPYK